MDDIRRYLLSIIAAAVITGMITGLLGKKGTYPSVVKMLCGLFVTLTIISPLKQIHFPNYKSDLVHMNDDAQKIIEQAKLDSQKTVAKLIKEKTEAYILKRAAALKLEITVDVFLNAEESYAPEKIYIRGAASASAKQSMQDMIENELGVSKENQIWN